MKAMWEMQSHWSFQISSIPQKNLNITNIKWLLPTRSPEALHFICFCMFVFRKKWTIALRDFGPMSNDWIQLNQYLYVHWTIIQIKLTLVSCTKNCQILAKSTKINNLTNSTNFTLPQVKWGRREISIMSRKIEIQRQWLMLCS